MHSFIVGVKESVQRIQQTNVNQENDCVFRTNSKCNLHYNTGCRKNNNSSNVFNVCILWGMSQSV